MYITYYGAVREVTGSLHLLTIGKDRILLDCGMFQGHRKEAAEKNKTFPFDPKFITNMVLSHAHIDHSGRIPLLIKKGFSGRIFCNRATSSACEYLLPDSAHIQESDAAYLNYKKVRSTMAEINKTRGAKKISNRKMKDIKNILKKDGHKLNNEIIIENLEKHGLEIHEPLYTIADAETSLNYFEGYPYNTPISIGKNMILTQYDAGHILGSAISVIRGNDNGREYRIAFSGDLGRFNKPIVKDPTLNFDEKDRNPDLLILESTYGNRVHEHVEDMKPLLQDIIKKTVERGGAILIPAFAFGRTQELLYVIHELYNAGVIPSLPVYVDSPLASRMTKVFGEHPEVYDKATHKTFLEYGENPFFFKKLTFVESVEDSININKEQSSHILLSASGMCESGRILHHLRHKIHNWRHTILIVGYMAENTLGRKILETGTDYEASGRRGEAPIVKILGKPYPLKAKVEKMDAFSGHGDKDEIVRFLKTSNLNPKKIALVHGEEEQIFSFAKTLENEGFSVVVPSKGETMPIV